jgi:hypothetical protein
MTLHEQTIVFSEELSPIGKFLRGEISVENFITWLRIRSVNRITNTTVSRIISEEEQALRLDAVRHSNASVELEGFHIPIEAVQLNEMFIEGEIDLEQKGRLLLKIYDV